MASQELQDQVKKRLFEEWLPDKPGGLKGLINMAADAALAVVGEIEGDSVHFSVEYPTDGDSNDDPVVDVQGFAHSPTETIIIDQTKYLCRQCGVTHQRDSGVGARHAHLFYGGQPAVVHLEHCPVLGDVEAICNCNAVLASSADRARDRREGDGSR